MEVIRRTGSRHTGTVVFLHGSGGCGTWLKEEVKNLCDFSFPYLDIIFPTAPLRPYSASGGLLSNVWFDRTMVHPNAPELLETIDATAEELVNFVNQEVTKGIPLHRIAIGGFSMGGCMAIHMGFRHLKDIAGVFALSSFLAPASAVYKACQETHSTTFPPLFMCHGTNDDLVPEKWGNDTYSKLIGHGIVGEYHSIANLSHLLSKSELSMLSTWLQKRIPDEDI